MSLSTKRLAIAAAVALILLGAGGTAALRMNTAEAQSAPAAPPPPPTVDVAEVVRRSVVDWQTYSGRLEPVDRVEIRPLVSGTLTTVNVREGGRVKKGDPLFVIDPRPYAVEVERTRALVAAATSRNEYAASDLARGKRLLAENAIARRDFDEKENAAREAAANLLGAQAALNAAQLNLGYTKITAPVDGLVSRADITLGNIVAAGAGTPPLATLVSVSKMYAAFDVDEQSYLKVVAPTREAGGASVFLGLANEDGYPREGKVRSVDNRLDVASGTIRVHAVFDNADGVLLPGLYARIRLGGGSARDALLIDERAVGTDQDKRFVLVVDQANKTAYREVRLGANHEGLRVVERGLSQGDRIVVNGLQRVRPGDAVTPHPVPMAGVGAKAVNVAAGK
jgi:multidrug efflux system membrane fusion protein